MASLSRWRPGAALGLGLVVGLAPRLAQADATQPLELVNPLVPADQCEYCHSFNNPPDISDQPIVAPVFTWRGSMMANSAVDPVFWAGVAIASQDAEFPEETEACVRCHSPRAFLEGRANALSVDDLAPQDRAGVECEACHRMIEDEPPGNAHFTFDDVLVGDNVPRRGPWEYPAEGGIPAPPHEVVTDDFLASSELCGTCHDVTTDRERVDDRGVGLGVNFNEQRTYSEWANSAYAQPGANAASCQDCHMPAIEDAPGCRDYVNVYAHREGGRRHDLLGANRFMIELMAEEAGVFDAVAFNHSLAQLDEFVQTSASIDVSAPKEIHLGDGLPELRVQVTNETGHKLPSGYSEGRVMWLEVVARVGEQVVWSSGQWDPEAQQFEQDPQVRRYEGVAVEYSSGDTFHLLRNDYWEVDTRIPPLGLTPDPQTDPVTDRYPMLDDGTWANYDQLAYAFEARPDVEDPTPDDSSDDVLALSVRLLYLINTRPYIQFLADENATNESGSEVAMLFDTAGGATPVVLAEQSFDIPIAGFGEPVEGSTGLDDTAGESGSASDSGTTLPGGTAESSTGQDVGGAEDGGGGCSCRTAPGSGFGGGFGPWALALGGVWARRRTRRRRGLA
ncbi:MAG: hypothetical protein AAF799_34075 [Myxococcota bacterium]